MDTKMPFYNIVNILLTGFIFIGSCIIIYFNDFLCMINSPLLMPSSLISESIITFSLIAVIYEIGLIINRFGSIVIEPILIKLRIIPFNKNYKLFNERKVTYPSLEILSREYALSRTSLTLFLIASILAFSHVQLSIGLVFLSISILFALSSRKHSGKIVKLME